jgi:hypothetical protein
MGYDERVWNKEKNNRKKPQDNVRRARFYGSPKELRNDDNENLSEDQVEQTEFLAQSVAVCLNGGLGGLEG